VRPAGLTSTFARPTDKHAPPCAAGRTWLRLGWNAAAKSAGKCNSRCAPTMNEPNNHCACLAYLTPTQISELEDRSKMQQVIVTDAPEPRIPCSMQGPVEQSSSCANNLQEEIMGLIIIRTD
jgi:hypothetical protein